VFQTLADQVRRSVRSVRGNQWMFRMGHPADHPLRLRPDLLRRGEDGTYPILCERTPVRMDLTHCGWSDIFFLGMDYPEGAKVLNVSIDLGVHGRDAGAQFHVGDRTVDDMAAVCGEQGDVFGGQVDAVPAAERGRAAPDIDGHVEHGSRHHANQLSLCLGRYLIMQAAQDVPGDGRGAGPAHGDRPCAGQARASAPRSSRPADGAPM
jgi:hypothetical protein